MALTSHPLPFGLREVRLFPLDNAGVRIAAASVLLPASRTFTFAEAVDSEDLEAEDVRYASHEHNAHVEWELEGGGVSLAVWKVIAGGTITTSGTTPNQKNTYKKNKTDVRPFFDAEGRAISDTGGDFHMVVYRCKATGDLEAELDQGTFTLTHTSGDGYGDLTTGDFYSFIQNETATATVPS
jgi:hypothetical protein